MGRLESPTLRELSNCGVTESCKGVAFSSSAPLTFTARVLDPVQPPRPSDAGDLSDRTAFAFLAIAGCRGGAERDPRCRQSRRSSELGVGAGSGQWNLHVWPKVVDGQLRSAAQRHDTCPTRSPSPSPRPRLLHTHAPPAAAQGDGRGRPPPPPD